MRFLLVDDHTIIREGIRKIILEGFPTARVDEVAGAEDVMNKVTSQQYDMVISDLSMPGRNGLDVVKQLKEIQEKLPVLILSMHPEEQYAVRALKAGAAGYLSKDSSSADLIKAIHRVLQGRKYISAEIAEKMSEDLYQKKREFSHEELSDREFVVFKLIAEGKSLSEIANQLSLSLSTVSTHRSRILRKMDMKGNADLIKYALGNNLL